MIWTARRRTSALGSSTYAGEVAEVLRWLRGHPWQADGLLALLLVVISSGQWQGRYSAGIAVVSVLPAGSTVQHGFGLPLSAILQPTMADVAILVLLYTVAAYRPRRVSLVALAACLAGSAAAIARWAPAHAAHPGGPLFAAAAGLGGAALTAWVLGDSVAYRYRRAYYASLEERAARL